MLDLLQDERVRVLGGVENTASFACPHCGKPVDVFPAVAAARSIWSLGVPRLASIPLDSAVARGGDEGTPVLVASPNGSSAEVFRAIARAVVDAHEHP